MTVRIGFLILAIQHKETNRRRVVDFDTLVRSDAPQRVIDMWQMIGGHVVHKGTLDGCIAQVPMQPADENTEIHACGRQMSLAMSS
jgi:hypothetical protein